MSGAPLASARGRKPRLGPGGVLPGSPLGARISWCRGIASSTPERLRKQYLYHLEGGEGVECFEHIAPGATCNPRRCLRICFSSKLVTDSRFAIGHVGRHFEVMSST
jgi:hypothetical protein